MSRKRTVNSYLEKKWRNFFKFLDRDRDGYVTVEDVLVISTTVCQYGGTSGKVAEDSLEELRKWWDHYHGEHAVDGKLDEDGFVASHAILYQDLEKMKKEKAATYEDIFHKIDTNGDGQISREELAAYYSCHNVTDEVFIRKVFQKLDLNKDGYIMLEEFLTAIVNYFTNDDRQNGYEFMYDPSSCQSLVG